MYRVFVAVLLLCEAIGAPLRHYHRQGRSSASDTWIRDASDITFSWIPDLEPSKGRTAHESEINISQSSVRHGKKAPITHRSSYETLWSNGSRTLSVLPDSVLNGSSEIVEASEAIVGDDGEILTSDSAWRGSRYRRLIFPPDSRIRVNTTLAAHTFPFSASVKLSTGCSGTLISRQHVLTSAHCVHNGKSYLQRTSALRVGFLKRSGKVRWVEVRFVRIPQAWTRVQHVRNDFSVLELQQTHKRDYFNLAVATKAGSRLQVHFSSFPGDKRSNTLWYAHCNAQILTDSIISRCDASRGSSGAGVYTKYRRVNNEDRRALIGILSGSGSATNSKGRIRKFNAATRITENISRQICVWTGFSPNCVSWKQRNVNTRRNSRD